MVQISQKPDDFESYKAKKQQEFKAYKQKKQNEFNVYKQAQQARQNGQSQDIGDEVVVSQSKQTALPTKNDQEITGGVFSVYNPKDGTTTEYDTYNKTVTVYDENSNVVSTRPLEDDDIQKAQTKQNENQDNMIQGFIQKDMVTTGVDPVVYNKEAGKPKEKTTLTKERLNEIVGKMIADEDAPESVKKALSVDPNYRKYMSDIITAYNDKENLKIDLDNAKQELSRLSEESRMADEKLSNNKDRTKYYELASDADKKRKAVYAQQKKVKQIGFTIDDVKTKYISEYSAMSKYQKVISEWKDGEEAEGSINGIIYKSTSVTLPDGRKAYKLSDGKYYGLDKSHPTLPNLKDVIQVKGDKAPKGDKKVNNTPKTTPKATPKSAPKPNNLRKIDIPGVSGGYAILPSDEGVGYSLAMKMDVSVFDNKTAKDVKSILDSRASARDRANSVKSMNNITTAQNIAMHHAIYTDLLNRQSNGVELKQEEKAFMKSFERGINRYGFQLNDRNELVPKE